MRERKLTKERRDVLRALSVEWPREYRVDCDYMSSDTQYVDSDSIVHRNNALTSLLDDLDAADAEIERLRVALSEATAVQR